MLGDETEIGDGEGDGGARRGISVRWMIWGSWEMMVTVRVLRYFVIFTSYLH
jgi:hypothetical protein